MQHPNALARLNRLLIGLWLVGGAVVSLSLAQALEARFLPVKEDIQVKVFITDGKDVVLTATAVKLRTCSFIAPVRARTEDGVNLAVVSSNPLAGTSWQPSDTPQFSGPWRVIGGAGQKFSVFQEFRCHPFWNQFQDLLLVDATGKKLKVEAL